MGAPRFVQGAGVWVVTAPGAASDSSCGDRVGVAGATEWTVRDRDRQAPGSAERIFLSPGNIRLAPKPGGANLGIRPGPPSGVESAGGRAGENGGQDKDCYLGLSVLTSNQTLAY